MQDYLRYATVILERGKMLIKSQNLYNLEYAGLPPLRYGDPGMGEMLIKSQNREKRFYGFFYFLT